MINRDSPCMSRNFPLIAQGFPLSGTWARPVRRIESQCSSNRTGISLRFLVSVLNFSWEFLRTVSDSVAELQPKRFRNHTKPHIADATRPDPGAATCFHHTFPYREELYLPLP